jgi:redox-sensitive bicupin YhaK (pirin superfamily)
VTVTLNGGLTHRDSLGVQQRYGNGEVQWLTAGRGMLHEEMWWPDEEGRSELYQLWLNLPAKHKMVPPAIQLFTPPTVDDCAAPAQTQEAGAATHKETGAAAEAHAAASPGVRVHVIGGEHGGADAGTPDFGRPLLTLLRVELPAGSSWQLPLPEGHNCLLYTRRGHVLAGAEGTSVPAHHLAYLPARCAQGTDCLLLANANGEAASGDVADVLVLAGQPLRESMVGGGTWVMNSEAELRQADRDYAAGQFGIPWEHTATDAEWQEHLRRTSTRMPPR